MEKQKTALEVIVDQKPGVITWNFDQLKNALAEKMKEYEGLVYTADTVPVAKQDIATLRKLKKEVSDKRIEIKKKCLEPYSVIEKQADELTKLLDTPINHIAKQLDEYEQQRKKAVRDEIEAYMADKYSVFSSEIAKKLMLRYDEKWENATTAKKTWKQAIDEQQKRTQDDITVLSEIEDEFKDTVMQVYSRNLVLAEAVSKVTELRKQKLEILARERERIAQEERRKAEEELRKKQEAVPAPNSHVHEVSGENIPQLDKKVSTEASEGSDDDDREDEDDGYIDISQYMAGPEDTEIPDAGNTKYYELRIRATKEQIAKIKGYIEYTGAVFTEREV